MRFQQIMKRSIAATILFGIVTAAQADPSVYDKNAKTPEGRLIELRIEDGRIVGAPLSDGMYRLSDGRLIKIRKGRVIAMPATAPAR
jgi:hypothetical protein